MDRNTRNLQHKKQASMTIARTSAVNLNNLPEGTPKFFFINGELRMYIRDKNEIYYSSAFTKG